MDFFSSFFGLVSIVCLLPFLFLLYLKYNSNQPEEKSLIPSPPKLPIIGNLHQLGKFPHRSLSQLSNKYGPAMLFHLGRVPTLIVSSAETAREVLKTHDLDCCSRPILTGPKRLSYNFLDIAFRPYGQYWREMRKICALELFSAKRMQSFQFLREEEVAHLVNSISQASPSPVNLTEKLFSLTDRIICRVAFGKSYFGRGFDDGRFHEAVTEGMVLFRSFSAADHFPYVGWIIDLLSGFHSRVEKCFHELDSFYEWVIDDHLDPKRPRPDHEDIIDVLLGLERSEHGAVRLTKDHIKAVLTNIFLGGVETSSVTTVWAMAELAKNPRVMRKLQKEIRQYVGSKGKVEENNLNQLVYLKMVVKETLRLHPPGTFLLPRETIRQCKINGYQINPKTRIEVNVWAIGRDPKYWECPEEFWPERFMGGSSIEFNGNHFEFLPFGSGRRGCPGMNMGTVAVEIAIANLLYSFDWELPGGMKNGDINMEESDGVAVHKKTDLYLVPIKHSWSPEEKLS